MSCGYIVDLIPVFEKLGMMFGNHWASYYWVACSGLG